MTLGFEITNLDEAYALEIRRGIVESHIGVPDDADLVLALTADDVINVLTGQTTFEAAVREGIIELKTGDVDDLERFMGYFETPDPSAIRLIAR